MTSIPKDAAATYPPAGPPPRARAAVKPGPARDTPVPDNAGPGANPRTWTLELPAGLMTLSLNGRLHWSEQRRRAAELKKAAWAIALREKVPHLGRVSLVVEYQPPDARHRDADNIPAASGKHVIDGIVAAGVIPDDEAIKYVAAIQYRIGDKHPGGRLILHITEVR